MPDEVRRGFALIALAFGVYACIYIVRTSFVIDGVRHFSLADDQMISMRYAENLVRGHGLVWNPGGPRVEGFTNPLWVLFMAVFHWLNVPRPVISGCIQASGALLLLANLFLVRAIAWRVSAGAPRATLTAVALVAFYVPLNNWAFQGTEVSLLAVASTAGTWMALRALDSSEPPLPLFVLLGTATLVRFDMIVFAGAIVLGLLAVEPTTGVRRLWKGSLIVVAFVAVQAALRLWYFGDVLPNTYYLKMSGFPALMRITRGLFVTSLFLLQLLPLLLPLWTVDFLRKRGRAGRLLLGVFAAQIAYSIFVGGDSWESTGGSNRFTAIAMPLLLTAVGIAVADLWDRLAGPGRVPVASGTSGHAPPYALVVAMLVVVLNVLALSVVRDPSRLINRLLLVDAPPGVEENERHVRAALAIRDVTTDGAVIAVTWAGAIPYFSERAGVDLLGKTDRRVAREPMRMPDAYRWQGFLPGHMKWNYDYSINRLEPDVIQAPLMSVDYVVREPTPYLDRDYMEVVIVAPWYLRRASGHVRWERVEELR